MRGEAFFLDIEGFVVHAGEVDDLEIDAWRVEVVIELGLDDEAEVGADGKLGLEGAHFEGDAAMDVGADGDGELEMSAGGTDAAGGRGDADVFEDEAGFGVAAAEGFEFFEECDGAGGAFVEGDGAVYGEGGDELFFGEMEGGEFVDTGAEFCEVGEGEFDAAGHGVTAAGSEEVAAVFDGEVKLEAGDGAGGAVGVNGDVGGGAVGGEDEGGAVVGVDDA